MNSTVAASTHPAALPLAIAGFALWIAAGIVRKIIKLALLIAVAGAAALAFAAWRSGFFA